MHPSRTLRKIALTLGVACMVSTSSEAQAAPPLQVVAQSRSMIWSGVAVDAGRIFVSATRWSGSQGPQVAVLDQAGQPRAYPDAAWNGWTAGAPAAGAFVNVNAIHLDGQGGLWVVDTGSPTFGGDPLPGGAKLVRIDLATNRVTRVYPLGAEIAKPKSYIDDVRFNGRHAYLTDAGDPGLIVLDLDTGRARRVLDDHPSTIAPFDRSVVTSDGPVRTADGKLLKVQADPLEVSPDGRWLYYGPLEGPWSKIATRDLDDETLSASDLAARVSAWADLPPTGGTAMAPDGTLYFTELSTNTLRRRSPNGRLSTVVRDARLHWVDALFLNADGELYLPVPQLDRAPPFQRYGSAVKKPVQLFRLSLQDGNRGARRSPEALRDQCLNSTSIVTRVGPC